MTISHEAFMDGGAIQVSELDERVGLQRGPRDLCQGAKGNEKNGDLKEEKKKQEEEEEAEAEEDTAAGEMRPPDGGWGWMVALGTFIIMTFVPMAGRCFGVIFSPYLLQEGSSSTTAAWIFNTQCFIWHVMGPIMRPLTKEFGWRKVGITGAVLASVSLMISAFTPSPAFLFFSYSLLSGAGGGVLVCMCFCILPLYFDCKRGAANAIMNAGICMGPMVGAPLVRLLQDEFGFRGAALILGALILHSCVGVSFFHPVEWHLKKSHPQVTNQPQEVDASLMSPEHSKLCVTKGFVSPKPNVSFTLSHHESESDLERITADARLRRRVGRRISEASWSSRKNSSLALSLLDVTSILVMPDADRTDEFESDDDSQTTSSVCTIVQRVAQSTISGLKVLRSPRACIIALGGCLCITGYFNFMMTVPFAMQASGHTLEDAAWCLSVAAICNLLVRLLASVCSDWPRFKIQRCYVAGFALISFTVFSFVRDVSNSYALSMWMVAGMLLTSFTLWLFMPVAVRYDQRRSEEKEQQELTKP
ncbi:uncharacterized protein [Panulirus ornatus]|uniref:uncharacterized protein isoform X2 n=1 Tax=Panulirus ornatus TaxID=150431 RepID=UPI003A844AC8